MGAKAAEQAKKPRPPAKCDVCGRKFVNIQALRSHRKFQHETINASKRSHKRQDTVQRETKVVPVNMIKRVYPPALNTSKKAEKQETPPKTAAKSSNVSKKPEFECPICAEKFSVYFSAFRHVQKKHCVDENGDKVPPNSPHLVKPIRIEMCASCGQEIRSTTPHSCPRLQANKDQYWCFGCEQVFNGLTLFQHHVRGIHSDGVQHYFFPTRDDFTSWKQDLQDNLEVDFVRLTHQKSKETYHCSHQTHTIITATKLCPAMITVREYTKGFHICYHSEHHGHTVGNKVLEKYDQYSITLDTKETERSKREEEDDDLYLQFKQMITSIVFKAATVDGVTLKDLIDKALEMSAVLKNYHPKDRHSPVLNKNLSDDQISKTLLDSSQVKAKRKISVEKETKTVVAKKVKKTPSSIENGVSTRLSRSSPAVNKSVSFPKNVVKDNKEIIEEETEVTEKETVTKKNEDPQKGILKKAEELPTKLVEEQLPVTRSTLQSPSSFNDSYKNFVDQNFKSKETSTPKTKSRERSHTKPKSNVKKKEVVKTKMGQFKQKSVSPKSVSPKSPKVIKAKPIKPDIEYVVKEQENDCNILILKI